MVQKIIVALSLLLFSVFSFFFLRFLCRASWLERMVVDYTVSPVDVVSLIVSAVVTIWIGWYIAKKLTEQRFEKDLLINDLRQIEENVTRIKQTFENSTRVDISLIASQVGIIHQLKQRFCDTNGLMNKDVSVAKLDSAINELYQYTTDFDMNYVLPENVNQVLLNQKCDKAILNVRELIILVNNR